jgi:hypothetical protein
MVKLATLQYGNDTGIDLMVRDRLSELGYNLHLNSAGIYEAIEATNCASFNDDRSQVQTEQSIPAFISKQGQEQEQEQEDMEMAM